jgi:excinuclease UvrABC ATPase subunit
VRLEDMPALKKNVTHDIEAVIDRIVTGSLDSVRLNDSVDWNSVNNLFIY